MKHKNDFLYYSALRDRKNIVDKLLSINFLEAPEEEIENLLKSYKTIMTELRNNQ